MKKFLLSIALVLGMLSGFAQGGHGHNGGGHPSHSNGGGNHGNGGGHGHGGGNHGHGNGHGHGHNGGGGWNAPAAMPQHEFINALEHVRSRNFDSDRLAVAKQITRNNLLTANQIFSMADLMSFESSRLDYAKFAYDYCFDRQNYYVVNNVFNFSSSVRELDEYIAARGPVGSGGSWGYNGNPTHVVVTTYASGNGNGMSYSGGVTSAGGACHVPAPNPGTFCGMCNHFHDFPYVCERSFASMLDAVEARPFDSDRLVIAKQMVRDRLLSADQVRRLVLSFSFERSRLEIAKFAYRFTFDKANYYVVNDSFTFGSSVRELDMFIRSC
jgi:hypothetical protein